MAICFPACLSICLFVYLSLITPLLCAAFARPSRILIELLTTGHHRADQICLNTLPHSTTPHTHDHTCRSTYTHSLNHSPTTTLNQISTRKICHTLTKNKYSLIKIVL